MAFFAELYGKLANKPVSLTGFAVYNLARNNNFSSEKAARELGYQTRSFEETIRDTILWLTAEGKVTPKNRNLPANEHATGVPARGTR